MPNCLKYLIACDIYKQPYIVRWVGFVSICVLLDQRFGALIGISIDKVIIDGPHTVINLRQYDIVIRRWKLKVYL